MDDLIVTDLYIFRAGFFFDLFFPKAWNLLAKSQILRRQTMTNFAKMVFDEDSTMIRERYLVLLLRSCLLSYWYWIGGRPPGWPVFILRGFALIYLTVVTSPSPSRFDLVHISWDGLVTTYVHAEGPTLISLLCNKSVILIGGLSQHL